MRKASMVIAALVLAPLAATPWARAEEASSSGEGGREGQDEEQVREGGSGSCECTTGSAGTASGGDVLACCLGAGLLAARRRRI